MDSGGRGWLTADTVSKVVIPVATLALSAAIYFGSQAASAADSATKAKGQCRDGTIALLGEAENVIDLEDGALAAASAGSRIAATDKVVARAQKVDVAGQFLDQNCKDAGLLIPLNVQRSLCTIARNIPDREVAAGLSRTADSIARRAGHDELIGCKTASEAQPAAQASAGQPVGAPAMTAAAPAARAAPPAQITLYIQYPASAGPGAVDSLRKAIAEHGLAGRKVRVPEAEAMTSPIASSTLRCLKSSDCAGADAIVGSINALLRRPAVKLLDLSARYDARSDVKPGDLELWLTADDVAALH